jgi:hypothetical protein
VLAEAPFVLHTWLRSGNIASGRGVCAILKEAFAQNPQWLALTLLALPVHRLTPSRHPFLAPLYRFQS